MKTGLSVLTIAAAALLAGFWLLGDDGESSDGEALAAMPGQPTIKVLTPRNGSRHQNGSAVVRVDIENFRLAPGHFGRQPRLAEGHIKFSLNRVPDCVDPEKLEEAMNSPRGSGRLTGRSFDFPEYSGTNGLLAAEIGSAGSYSPATEPHILYSDLPWGFYRLVVTLARNNGITTPAHAVTTFEILPTSNRDPEEVACEPGQVAAAEAAERIN